MSRVVNLIIGHEAVQRDMPLATDEVLPGVPWGDPWVLFTPSYWLAHAWMSDLDAKADSNYRARDGVVGELGFCLLGGYGITAELATAAYERCQRLGLFDRYETRPEPWVVALSSRFQVGSREVKYRYPNQKARFLADAMAFASENTLRSDSGRNLRDQLLQITGVGYKTASWVARNVLNCDDVAILDIHLIRAGQLCGIFTKAHRVERNYLDMEDRFLAFCRALHLRPAALDCLIWDEMRAAGPLPLQLLDSKSVSSAGRQQKRKNASTSTEAGWVS